MNSEAIPATPGFPERLPSLPSQKLLRRLLFPHAEFNGLSLDTAPHLDLEVDPSRNLNHGQDTEVDPSIHDL